MAGSSTRLRAFVIVLKLPRPTTLGALWVLPIAGAGFSATAWQEATVQVLQVALVGLSVVGPGGRRA
jgi:hypothetical protein